MGTKRIIVIGGSAAGPKAASKARRMDEDAEITIFQKASDLSMASCGYPYYVGGFLMIAANFSALRPVLYVTLNFSGMPRRSIPECLPKLPE